MIEVGDLVYPTYYGETAVGVVCDVYEPLDGYMKLRAKILMKNGTAYNFLVEELSIHTKRKDRESKKK